MLQASRRTDPYPFSWEIPVGIATGTLLALILGVQIGRGLACWFSGVGWVWPASRTLFTSLPDLLAGDAGAGLADPAQASLVSSSALMGWIVVVQLVTITLGIAATGWLLRRWGPHRMKGMASPAEAERLLGLRRLRKVATVIRPDLYAATPKGDHHDGYHPTR